jgi:uncharacterized delta-60 repeat protein
MANLLSGLWSLARRPSARPRRGGWSLPAAPALEDLERRLMLTAGDVRWDVPADLSPDTDDYFLDVAVQADGKIVAVGKAEIGGDDDFLVARYTAAGRLDQSFNNGLGYRTINFVVNGNNFFDTARAVVIQDDGKIVVAGGSSAPVGGSGELALVRLNPNGTLDTSYGTAGTGKVLQSGTFSVYAGEHSIALAPGGGVVVGASKWNGGQADVYGGVYKFTAAGVLDSGFNGSGFRDLGSSLGGAVRGLAVDASGRVVAVTGGGTVVRLTASGAFDGTFSGDGVAAVGFETAGTVHAEALALMPDGRIVVGGHTSVAVGTSGAELVRLKANGDYDNTFDGNGRYAFDPTPGDTDEVDDLAVLADGTVVVAGHDLTDPAASWIAAVKPEGVLDGRFAGDGIAVWSKTGFNLRSYGGLAVTPDGHFVVAGDASQGAPDSQGGIALFQGLYGRRDDLLGWTATGAWYAAGSTGSAFGNRYYGTWNPNAGWKVVTTVDITGDGLADAIGRASSGQWWIGINTGTGFRTVAGAKWNETAGWHDLRFADFDGDGKTDIAGRTSAGGWWVSLSTGAGMGNGRHWATWSEAAQWRDVLVADFDGDGRADLAGRTSRGQWYVGLSTGTEFSFAVWDTWAPGAGWQNVMTGDFDGDGRQDIAGRTSAGGWWVAKSTGSAFSKSFWGTWSAGMTWADVTVSDFDGDGLADIIGRVASGQWYLAFSSGSRFDNFFWGVWNPNLSWRDVRIGDFDGDGDRDDVAGRTSSGVWYVSTRLGGSTVTTRWGQWNEGTHWTVFKDEFVPTV